jgi:hypothetical protein
MTHTYRRQIHEEILHIVETVGAPAEQEPVLRRRRLVHQTWIGLEEIRGGKALRAGLWRILSRGSLVYLVFRPLLLLARSLHNRTWARR